MAYTADMLSAPVAADLKAKIRAGGLTAQPGGDMVVARIAPATTPPVIDNVTTDDTGLVDVGSVTQSVAFVPTIATRGEIVVLATDSTYGLHLSAQNSTLYSWSYALYQNVETAFAIQTPGPMVRTEVRESGDILTFQGANLINTLKAAKYLARNAALGSTNLTKARAFGEGMTNVSVGKYAPYYAPLSVVSAIITTDGKARVVLDYYSPQDGIDIAITGPDGGLARSRAKIIENSVAGRVTIESGVLPTRVRGGAPVTITMHLASNSGFPGVQASAAWAGPMLFTINVTQPGDWYGNMPLANHLALDDWRGYTFGPSESGLRGPEDANPQVNFKGDLIEGTTTKGSCFIVPPRIPGQRMRYKWKGSATLVLDGNGDSAARNQHAGSDGVYSWVDFNFDYSLANFIRNGAKDRQFLWAEIRPTGTGSQWPTELDCRPIDGNGNAISPGFWDKPYLDEIKAVIGHQDYDIARFMDCQRTVHISHLVIDRVTQQGDRASATGVSVDDILAFCEYVGCDARINLPMQATRAWVKAEARKAARWCKRTGRRCVIEWANEIWNSSQGAWSAALTLGKAMGLTGTSDHDITMKYHSFGNVERMAWCREEFEAEGVENLFIPVICVQNSNRGNQTIPCEHAPGAIDSWKRLEVAPYIAGYAAIREPRLDASGQWDNEGYMARARGSYRIEHDNAAYHRDYAFSLNRGFGTYEGGQEDAGDNAFHKQFQITPLAGILADEQLADWEVTVGGAYRWYADNRYDKYGLRVFAGQPRYATGSVPGAPVWDAWLKAIDRVKADA